MSNLLQYTDKSKTIDEKLNSLLNEISYDYNNGKIRTETEYYYRIKNALSIFYQTLDKPSFKFRPASTTPISQDYNSMISESCEDMKYIINDCMNLSNTITRSYSDAKLSRDMMTNELSYLAKKIDSIGQGIALNRTKGSIVFTEMFNDQKLCGNIGNEKACCLDTINGVLTLDYQNSSKAPMDCILVDEKSTNGFLGNTHVVNTLNGEIYYEGQDGLHNDLKVLFERTDKSWVEFELIEISDETKQMCNSYGFEYKEGISWISDDGYLRVKLIAKLSSPTLCSWFVIAPHLPSTKGVKPSFIEKCEIITSSNNVIEVMKNEYFDSTKLIAFPPQSIQEIQITLKQSSFYQTNIGHTYFTSTDTKSMTMFKEYESSHYLSRIDGNKISVNAIGATYNPSTKWLDYQTSNTKLLEESYAKDILFTAPQNTILMNTEEEILPANRYMIGISSMSLYSCNFNRYGEYVSIPMQTEDPITSIVLETKEYIPGDDPEILQYFISIDNGTNWHKIYPTHRAYTGIYKYTINNDSIENLLSDETDKKSKNITYIGDATHVQIKIQMNMANIENAEYTTPIVYQYKLKLTTGGDTIEY